MEKLEHWLSIQLVTFSFWISAVLDFLTGNDDDEPPSGAATVTGYGLRAA